MKIGVLGNCQSGGWTNSFAALVPDAQMVSVRLDEMQAEADRTPENYERLAAQLADCDIVFSMFVGSDRGPLATERLKEKCRTVYVLPVVGFHGFFPDSVYVFDSTGRMVNSAVGAYNSALTLACFLEGIPPERAYRLFNAYVFAELGYFDVYATERELLIRRWTEIGYDAEEAFAASPSKFMHTINHPSIGMLYTVARQALRLAGVPTVATPTLPEDTLGCYNIWPIYPVLADRLGLCGSELFQINLQRTIDLKEMILGSYKKYAECSDIIPPAAVEKAREFLRAEVSR